MSRLIWTKSASDGLLKVFLFLNEKDADAAAKAVETIVESAGILRKFPNAGRPADDLDPEHRELLIPFGASGYIIVYEVYADSVLVLAVRHQKEAGY